MLLMSGSCAKGFYSNRIQIVAKATKLTGYIRYALRQNSVHFQCCPKGFYSNRIWIEANATKLIG